MTGLRFDTYHVEGRHELMMRHGPGDKPVILLLLPFFHEHDRLRAFAGGIMRALGECGFASALPDMPGQNESMAAVPLRLDVWRAAAAAAAQAVGATAVLSLRSGALLDAVLPADRQYRFVPATGGALVRDLRRAALLASRERGRTVSSDEVIWIGGRELPADLLDDLEEAEPADVPGRTARLDGDARPADVRFAGELLWRRSEPGSDIILSQRLACDVSEWMRRCGAA